MTAHHNERVDTSPARYRVRLPGFVSDEGSASAMWSGE
jgi:hypothetical protein